MSKQIIIIGGGISGLSVLHHLKKKFADRADLQVLLIEKNAQAGGVIATETKNDCLFETGPEGFLNSKSSTIELVEDLGLKDDLIPPAPGTKTRYLCIQNKLYQLPLSPAGFLRFPPFSVLEKLRVLTEFFVPGKPDPQETIYQFGSRRFGKRFTECFLDAMATGIYGGDIRQLNLKTSFGMIYAMEEKYGSVLKGAIKQIRAKKRQPRTGEPKIATGQLLSLRQGLGQLINALQQTYKEHINVGEEVYTIAKSEAGYVVETNKRKYFADEVFICAPAYNTARLVRQLSDPLGQMLARIEYIPMTVIGLVYNKSDFKNVPHGFGYLVPSGEGKKILGVLFSSNVFTDRCGPDDILLRVMMRGRGPETVEDAIKSAQEEIDRVFHVSASPKVTFRADWPAAVPQYTSAYQAMTKLIADEVAALEHLHIVANYWGGVGINDCTQNAKNAVAELTI